MGGGGGAHVTRGIEAAAINVQASPKNVAWRACRCSHAGDAQVRGRGGGGATVGVAVSRRLYSYIANGLQHGRRSRAPQRRTLRVLSVAGRRSGRSRICILWGC